MTPEPGCYSLIQFCPDPSRLEAVNVGVLLFSPRHCFLKALTARGNSRVRQFFGKSGYDGLRLNSFKKGLEERIQAENANIHTLADLEGFIARRAGQLQITPPRPLRVTDPERDLRRLFHELVGGQPRSEQPTNVEKVLREQFAQAGLSRKVRTDIQIVVPAFGRRVEVSFGYQNGRFNLIKPVRFQAPNPARVIPTACRYAVEGDSLYNHPDPEFGALQLIILGQFPASGSSTRNVVANVLAEHQVRLFSTTELPTLIDEIRQTGKDLDSEPTMAREGLSTLDGLESDSTDDAQHSEHLGERARNS